ncbi:mitochondrial sodium/calcium exchanger protein-like [Glandiceps talaboti]
MFLKSLGISSIFFLFSLILVPDCGEGSPLSPWRQKKTLDERDVGNGSVHDIAPVPGDDFDDYDDAVMCDGIQRFNYSGRCDFILHTADCLETDGFFNYLKFEYCTFPNDEALSTIAVIILIIVLLYLFLALGTIAANFFCPCLDAIAKALNLSDNVAGVTFLAFGNGAPDIFACIAAVTGGHGENNGLRLVVGELFGGGMFVTTVVVGAVCMVASPFRLGEVPFMRDIIFYLGATFWTYWIVWDGKVSLYEGLGYIALYGIFVIVVLVGHKLSQIRDRRGSREPVVDGDVFILTESQKAKIESTEQKVAQEVQPHKASEAKEVPTSYGTGNVNSKSEQGEIAYKDSEPLVGTIEPSTGCKGYIRSFCLALIPIDWSEWHQQSLAVKILNILKIPIMVLAILTVPLVDRDKDLEKRNWNKTLNSMHMLTSPMFAVFVIGVAFKPVSGGFLAWHLTLIIGFIMAVIVILTSRHEKPPVYHTAFAFAGFLMGIVWIYTIANEIVNLLEALGIMFNLSEELLGLLLLALGNSIADLVTDTANARAGHPVMSIGACFGGPLFNMLLGFGLSSTIGCLAAGTDLTIEYSPMQSILFSGLTVSLLTSLVIMLICWFKVTKPYGIYLFFLYSVFLLIIILVETEIINF